MPSFTPLERNRLRALRARAERRGIAVDTSRRAISPDQMGGVMLRDMRANTVIAGARFDLSIDDAEAWLSDHIALERSRPSGHTPGTDNHMTFRHYDGTPCASAGDIILLPGMKVVRDCTFGELRDAIPIMKLLLRAAEERVAFDHARQRTQQKRNSFTNRGRG